MEGRPAPKAAAASARPGWLSRKALLVFAAIVLLLALIALLRTFAVGTDETRWSSSAPAQPPAASAAQADGPDAARGAAMIVDDPAHDASANDHANRIGAGDLPAVAETATNAAAAPVAQPAEATATARNTRKPAGNGRNARKAAAGEPKPDPDLLTTLLGIIKQNDAGETKHESMDALIADIQKREQEDKAATEAAFDSIDSHSTTANSGIQVQLRKCPKATTAAGMECRNRICAKWAGKDPACPAKSQ